MLKFNEFTLYLVTDRQWLKGQLLTTVVEDAIMGGVKIVQLREKELQISDYISVAKPILKICRKHSVPLIINDNVEVARAIGADGVHLGASDEDIMSARKILGNDVIIGASARTVEGALAAQTAGANYLGVGAVFGTTTKDNAQTIDIATLAKIVDACDIPIFAIGGVNAENIFLLRSVKLAGAAVISAILNSDNVKASTEYLLKRFNE